VHLPHLFDVFPSSSAEVAGDAEAAGSLNEEGFDKKEFTVVESVGLGESGETDDWIDGARLLGRRSRLPDLRRVSTLSTLRSTDVVTRSSLFGLGTKSLLPLICSLCWTYSFLASSNLASMKCSCCRQSFLTRTLVVFITSEQL
jgi:hypothetical protein